MSKNRIDKINTELLKAVSEIINNKLKDPRITGMISVLSIKTTADLKHADVFISIYNGKNNKETIETINKSAGFIRSELSRKLILRTIPNIHFKEDDSLAYSQKITGILKDINNERKI